MRRSSGICGPIFRRMKSRSTIVAPARRSITLGDLWRDLLMPTGSEPADRARDAPRYQCASWPPMSIPRHDDLSARQPGGVCVSCCCWPLRQGRARQRLAASSRRCSVERCQLDIGSRFSIARREALCDRLDAARRRGRAGGSKVGARDAHSRSRPTRRRAPTSIRLPADAQEQAARVPPGQPGSRRTYAAIISQAIWHWGFLFHPFGARLARFCLRQQEGRALYWLRQQTAEPGAHRLLRRQGGRRVGLWRWPTTASACTAQAGDGRVTALLIQKPGHSPKPRRPPHRSVQQFELRSRL